ncbi:MAG: transcription-repair coupling factor [Phycisphaeraceae bacterium]
MTHPWLDNLLHDPVIDALIARLAPGKPLNAAGSWGSGTHLLAGAIHKRVNRPVLLVVAHLDDADEAADDLRLFDELEPAVFPALEVMPGETNVSLELLADRLALVGRVADGRQPPVIVAPVQALMQSVPQPGAMGQVMRLIRRGDELPQGHLAAWLDAAGYDRAEVVEQPGQFAVRGGIFDIFPPGNSPAVRLDYFGDQIDALCEIDLDSMASGRKLESVRLISANTETIQAADETTGFWSLLDRQTIVVMHETLEIAEQARGYYERLTDARGIYSPPNVFQAMHRLACLEVSQFAAQNLDDSIILPIERLHNFSEKSEEAIAELAELSRTQKVFVLCSKEAEKQRLAELLAQFAPEQAPGIALELGYLFRGFAWKIGNEGIRDLGNKGMGEKAEIGFASFPSSLSPLVPQSLSSPPQSLSSPPQSLPFLLVPHHELFHRYATRRRMRRVTGVTPEGGRTFFDIDVGEYVVHCEHGIAVFRGLRTMTRDGQGEEYLTLEFADRALLHVPVSQIDLVQKYIGGFSGKPPLSKLGGKRWKTQKEAVAESVKDLAAQLLAVQAVRASQPGIRYPDDTPWMTRFEEEFPYEETEDQLAGMQQIKRDMMTDRPMDRLICGDVGFGKTELAIRAAFKAVEGGKQVAVLCPTTVLCEQHERTFRQRMADYPVRVESMSRFKTGSENNTTIAGLAAGHVDIVIGTHRILSDDVTFKDLGLVVIDEEQKFGVEHKSKLMRFRLTVDVLTLSATPIPRTLHLALLGLRDISSLATPPADRRAIVTEVIPFDRKRVRNAILRELNRGGQCFFLHNRVHDIISFADQLRQLVPEARFIVGHGQMKAHELEDVMLKFIRGKADVLVSTTIIESGIDIPTANTMFIHDADIFGLAELHQLRGRVGRYKHRAYCYLLLPETRSLSDVSAKRLRAIEQYSMLGAGFKIAMRDMEIRGVGNILGPEQSGHIATVGYQMYCQLLEEATARLKREQPRAMGAEVHLELGITGQLPKSYIPSAKARMEVYRRIGGASDFGELERIERATADAYGPLPAAGGLGMRLAEIRLALAMAGVESLRLHEHDLIFTTRRVTEVYAMLENAPGSVRLVDAPTEESPARIYYRPPENYLTEPGTLLAVLRKLLVRPVAGKPGAC